MNGGGPGLSVRDMYIRGTVIAGIVTAPSLAVFGASWIILDDLVQAAIIGGVAHFVSMIFAFKVSRRLFPGK
ncbi:hypothetical protein CENSYa_0786 [Cenarchaeum symbiosum A]|uniref:Uncharacterized protein n=1 Tax=Cenarchaeum symbiosum (strain A) TaxID=414004 RepID=A0RVQ2_CENSY|nr:hypothetical protein CENSYa_0786 [Cenarchaeum symbiosum A]